MRQQVQASSTVVRTDSAAASPLRPSDDVPHLNSEETSRKSAAPPALQATPIVSDSGVSASVEPEWVSDTHVEVPQVGLAPPVAKTKSRWGRYVLGTVFLAIAWMMFAPSGPDACEGALAGVTSESRPETARGKALEAISICKGDGQQKAKVLFADLERKIAAIKSCELATTEFKSLLIAGRLSEASALTTSKMRICPGGSAVQAATTDLEEVRKLVSSKLDSVRMKIEAGAFADAQQVLNEVQKMDRDNPAITGMRTSIERAQRELQTANQSANQSPPTVVSRPEPATQATTVQSQRDSAAAEMASAMLRDGESALAQRRYSDAKALANSVLRVVPSPQARDLLTRATEAESRALRNETTLK